MSEKVTQLDRHAKLCRQQAAAAPDPGEQNAFLRIAADYENEADAPRQQRD